MKKKKALITGINGQDGSYLAEFLLSKNYEVHGILRRSSSFNTKRIDHLITDKKINNKNIFFYYGDVLDYTTLFSVIHKVTPDEIYNLAAQSHVKISFEVPYYTSQVNTVGILNILEAIKSLKLESKIYQASTSEMFGNINTIKAQNENTPFKPQSPYAVSKVYAHELTRNYREAYNIYCCSGILFNHESPRRGETFVTKKITNAVRNIKNGSEEVLSLGNIYSKRDWGYAPEYVRAMWLMLQNESAKDYVVATGFTYTVKEFVDFCFKEANIEISWEGKGINEVAYNKKNGKLILNISEKYFRPIDVEYLKGDPSKIKKDLGWQHNVSIDQLVKKMYLNTDN